MDSSGSGARVVLVTGAAAGIGRATALAFAREGALLLLVDLDPAGLEHTHADIIATGGRARTYPCDVADADAVQALADRIRAEHGGLQVLINNAGISANGAFLDTDLSVWRRQLEVNLLGAVHCCRALIPLLELSPGRARIINVASVAAYFAPRDMSAYAASKFALLGFSESLRAEMASRGISVSVICPGIIDTGIHQRAHFAGPVDAAQRRRDLNLRRHAGRAYPPEKVAQALLKVARHGPALRPVAPEAWLLYYLKRCCPGLLAMLERRRHTD